VISNKIESFIGIDHVFRISENTRFDEKEANNTQNDPAGNITGESKEKDSRLFFSR
jgi:hypothetical protein